MAMSNPVGGLARAHPMELVLFVLLALVLFSMVFGFSGALSVLVDWLVGFFAALLFVFAAFLMTQARWKGAIILLAVGFTLLYLVGSGTL